MMNTKLFAHEIAASDLEVVGCSVFESYAREPRPVIFVPASEEVWTIDADYYRALGQGDEGDCYCCCCTGECSSAYDDWTDEDEEAYQAESRMRDNALYEES